MPPSDMRSLTDGLEPDSAPARSSGGGLREKLTNATAGPVAKIVLVVILLAVMGFALTRFFSAMGPNPATTLVPEIRIMNPMSGEMRWFSPAPGKRTPDGFYPVEYCWNNHPEDIAVPVIINQALYPLTDPRREEPTTCPCCGAPVFGHNPKPAEFDGMTPKDQQTNKAPDCIWSYYRQQLGG